LSTYFGHDQRPITTHLDHGRPDRQAAGRQVWTPSDFTDLGGRDAVDKALQRRQTQGVLRRIGRGLYDKPKLNSLT